MSVFGKQLIARMKRDKISVSEAAMDAADAAQGKTCYHDRKTESESRRHEVEKLCRYYQLPVPEEIPYTRDINDLIDYVTRPSGMMHRRVMLEGNWWKEGDGPVLAVRRDNGHITALLPYRLGGYYYLDEHEQRIRITKANKDMFDPEALCFYRPLPERSITGRELIRLMLRSITWADMVMLLLTSLMVTGIGMLTPMVTKVVFGQIIPTGMKLLVISMILLLTNTAVAVYIISVVRNGLMDRIRGRMEIFVMNAVMGRVMNLPLSFFSRKTAGGLSQSILALKVLPDILTDSILTPGITVLFSLAYLVQIASIASYLAIPAFVTFLVQLLIIVISVYQKIHISTQEMAAQIRTQGMSYAILSGIQRIRLSGSENRMFARWTGEYRQKANAAFPTVFPCSVMTELVGAVTLLGTLWVYGLGVKGNMDVSEFAAFLSAYSLVSGALTSFSSTGQALANIRPTLQLAAPVLRALPETSSHKVSIGSLRGNIEMSHVVFRYAADGPLILNDLNLKIKAGEYVGIVGKSGCGKSTLLKILMGFESPQEGAVFYDDTDMAEIDPISLRKNIGAVLQGGQLFAGDIFSNITISAPWLKMQDAWEAAEMAGMADSIREMPQGMHTLVGEGAGGLSGGQRQRLMIARAIAPKPKILLFDEATSALDNVSQKTVSDSLRKLSCTRIVIAHRLSAIRRCDRIIVLDQGRIAESGTYEELISRDGIFKELVERQQL